MRLLFMTEDGNVSYTEFTPTKIPPYAILSHTWGLEEVIFDDLLSGTARSKAGYRKILFCGQQAARDNLQYFWVDTCCIDKRNLVELTRSINSMFRWYRNAVKCYVYMADVCSSDVFTPAIASSAKTWQSMWEQDFRESRWFTRGWTLQELLAPTDVEFYSPHHLRLGDKKSLCGLIRDITGISERALQGRSLDQFPVSTRLAWAAKRQTTEEEDGAYCLLGLFNIFMPLIYGEGKDNALRRLQKEIDGLPPKARPAKPVGARFVASGESTLILPSKDPVFESSTIDRLKDESMVRTVAFSPDGRQLASGSHGKIVKLWEVTLEGTLGPYRTLTGHSGYIYAVEFASDGKLLASCSSDAAIIWDVGLGLSLQRFEISKTYVWDVAFSPNCKLLATGSSDCFVKVWSVQKNNETATLTESPIMVRKHMTAVHAVSFSPDGKLLACGEKCGNILLWNLDSNTLVHKFAGYNKIVYAVSFSPDSKMLASCGEGGRILIGQCQGEVDPKGLGEGWTVKFADLAAPKNTRQAHFLSGSAHSVTFSPNGKLLASCGNNKKVILWNTSSGEMLQILHGHTEYVLDLSFSPDGRFLASCGEDKTIRIWKALSTMSEVADSEDSTSVLFDLIEDGKIGNKQSVTHNC